MAVKIQTIKDIRLFLAQELKGIYPEPEISAMSVIITRTLFGYSKLHALSFPETNLTKGKSDEAARIVSELKTGKPLQYILGETEFYNLRFRVNSHTLIPRPETEELVDLIIRENSGFKGSLVDAGTGSGCIVVALSKNFPDAAAAGFDISEEALSLARENAEFNHVKVLFYASDIFDPEFNAGLKPDILVCNPPYVRESEKTNMHPNVLEFEPHNALFVPDSDPLIYYRALCGTAKKALQERGRIYFEINDAFGREVAQLCVNSGFSVVEIIKDINGKDRIVKGIKND